MRTSRHKEIKYLLQVTLLVSVRLRIRIQRVCALNHHSLSGYLDKACIAFSPEIMGFLRGWTVPTPAFRCNSRIQDDKHEARHHQTLSNSFPAEISGQPQALSPADL